MRVLFRSKSKSEGYNIEKSKIFKILSKRCYIKNSKIYI